MKIGPLGGPILAGTEVHGPRKSVRGVVFYYLFPPKALANRT